MKRFTRVLTRVLLALVIIVVLVGAGGAYYLKSYIPNRMVL
ncbi:MAG: hypothetical protein P8Y72_17925 [Anaerolineales bacterium]